MKTTGSIAIAITLAALVASEAALAQHRGHYSGRSHYSGGSHYGGGTRIGIGIGFGVPFYGYHPYYAPYYYQPVVVAPAAPPVYIERQDLPPVQPQAQAAPEQHDWFYCPDSKTYYPYVQQCAGEWQRVTPRPPER